MSSDCYAEEILGSTYWFCAEEKTWDDAGAHCAETFSWEPPSQRQVQGVSMGSGAPVPETGAGGFDGVG